MPAILYEPCRNNIFSYSYQRQALLCLLLLLLADFPDWTHLADNLLTCVSRRCAKASQSTWLQSSSRWEQLRDRHTRHAKSLSTGGGVCVCVCVRFPFTLSGVTHQFLTQLAMRMRSSCLFSTGARQTMEYLPQRFLVLMSLILSNWTFYFLHLI